MPALPPSQRGPRAPASSEDDAPTGLAAYFSAAPPTWILLGGCYLLYRAVRIRMRRRAQADDRGCHDDECDCEDDKAGWIGAREEGYWDDPVDDAEAHRLRAAQLAKHTRVYGGGVCLACLESERIRAAMGLDGIPSGPPVAGGAIEGGADA
ncbi:hypothetical protein ACLOAV_010337 [Pseudogymnoascus australis]